MALSPFSKGTSCPQDSPISLLLPSFIVSSMDIQDARDSPFQADRFLYYLSQQWLKFSTSPLPLLSSLTHQISLGLPFVIGASAGAYLRLNAPSSIKHQHRELSIQTTSNQQQKTSKHPAKTVIDKVSKWLEEKENLLVESLPEARSVSMEARSSRAILARLVSRLVLRKLDFYLKRTLLLDFCAFWSSGSTLEDQLLNPTESRHLR
jgi:hypothetical protein